MKYNANKITDVNAINLVEVYLINKLGVNPNEAKAFVVWKCKTIQNVKFIVGTNYNNYFFELTLNGDADELYIDVYKKIDKVVM